MAVKSVRWDGRRPLPAFALQGHRRNWSADINYTGSYFSSGSLSNDPMLAVDSDFIVNARAGYEHGHFRFTAFVDNLFDEEYLTSLSNGCAYGATPTEAAIGDGRKFDLEVSGRF